jgi:hypothetical protein
MGALSDMIDEVDAQIRLTPSPKFDAARAALVADAWAAGDLRFLLDETQRRIYDAAHAAWRLTESHDKTKDLPPEALTLEVLKARPKRQFAARCSRRIGKSTVAGVFSLEIALQRPGSRIVYVAKDAVHIAKVVFDIFEHPDTGLFRTCPKAMRPNYREQAKTYEVGTSRIEFYGADDEKIEDLRGGAAHFVVPDEIGAWQEPVYAIQSVLIPLTHTTGGRIYIPTTPAKTSGHTSKAFLDAIEKQGLAIRLTIIDSKRLTPIEKVEALVDAGEKPEHALEVVKSGGRLLPRTTTARRELFVMDVTDAGSAVLPEFQDIEEKLLVRVVDRKPDIETAGARYVVRPAHYYGFTVVDPAPTNIIAVVVGFHDFLRARWVFQRSRFLRGAETSADELKDAIEALERLAWGPERFAGGRQQPHSRVIDPDSGLEKELRLRGMHFRHANKKDVGSVGARQALRAMLTSVQIEIDEENVELRRQMRESVMNKRATDIAFEEDGTHGDGIKAVQYAVRTVPVNVSPFPEGWSVGIEQGVFRPPPELDEQQLSGLQPDTDFARQHAEEANDDRAGVAWWNNGGM